MENILFVDEGNINSYSLLRGMLFDNGFRCIFASSEKEAWEIIKDTNISVICTHVEAPQLNGLSLLNEIKQRYTKTARLILCEHDQLGQILPAVNQADIFKFVLKPVQSDGEFRDVLLQAAQYNKIQAEHEKLSNELKEKNIAYNSVIKKLNECSVSAKSDIQLTTRISTRTIDYLGSLFSKDRPLDELQSDAKEIYDIYSSIINIVMSDYNHIVLKDLMEINTADIKGKSNITKFDLICQTKAKKILLKPQFLFFIISILEKYFIYDERRYHVKFQCDHNIVNDKYGMVDITILISCISGNNTSGLTESYFKDVDQKIILINKYLDVIMNDIRSSMSAARVGIDTGIKIQLYSPL